MSVKTHLADSEVPLKEGSKLLAICGAIVPDAAFVFMWDETANGVRASDIEMSGLLSQCSRCKKIRLTQRYLYGIVSGQESATHAGKIIDESIAMVEIAEKRAITK
jgi:hypothetical protein